MRARLAVALAVVVVTGLVPRAAGDRARQQAPAGSESATQPSSTGRSKPGLIRITAVVTDPRGRPVTGLSAGDFEIREDGVAYQIESAATGTRTGSPAGPARVPRTFAFLLDEFHVSSGPASALVRDAVSAFIRDQVQPDDLLIVLKPLDPLTGIRFTTDRDAALAAVASFEGRRGDYTPRSPLEQQLIGSIPARVRADRARIVASGLRELATRMGRAREGHGAVVLVSEGFAPAGRVPRGRPTDVQTVVRTANYFDLPIYVLAPHVTTGEEMPERERNTLETLARDTGGQAVLAAPEIPEALSRVARDLDASYVLMYRSAGENDGKYRTVSVQARRGGVQVRARPGYWAPLGALTAARFPSPAAPAPGRVRVVRRSTLIDSWIGFTRGDDGQARVTLTWIPRRTAVGDKAGPQTVTVKALVPGGATLYEGRIVAARGADEAAGPAIAIFAAPPGRVEVDLTVLDGRGEQIDTDARDVDVPALGSERPVLLTPQVIRTASAREFRAASADPDAAPTPVREFRRTERLLVRVPAYDASGRPLPVMARMLNRVGQVMWEVPELPERARDGMSQFDVSLAPLAPGEYSIDLRVSSPAGEANERIWIRVTG